MQEGDQITPNLTLIRWLGRPDSRVWLARDAKLDQDVAVKVLGKALASHTSQFHRFLRESAIAAQIKNAHVAQILAQGTSAKGVPYLEMELLAGEDLGRRLARDGTLPIADVVRLISQLAQGLGKAHMLGLVHRNLKPGNIFLSPAAEGPFAAKVLDLGLSSGSDLLTASRAPVGAPMQILLPEYASPEQVFGVKDVDFRTDLWAVAVIAYHALTGRVPFPGPNPEAFFKAIERGIFDPPSQIVPSLPPSVDVWFGKAFQRDPAARFGGVKELADEFVRAARGDSPERTTTPSGLPSIAGQRAAIRSGEFPAPRMPAASIVPEDDISIVGVRPNVRSSSAVVVALMAIVGIGTILAGLSLLNY